MSDAPFRFRIRTMLLVVLFLSYVLAAYTRGDYLLGSKAGLMYAIGASTLAVLFYRALSDNRTTKLQLGVLAITTLLISAAFSFPQYLNPVIQYYVEFQADERLARSELAQVFASDPAFGNLSISTERFKVVFVEIQGSVPTASDLDRLRTQVLEECEFVNHCGISWNILVSDSGKVFTGAEY